MLPHSRGCSSFMVIEPGWEVVLGVVAWSTLALFLVGAVVGTTLLGRRYRLALAILSLATISGFGFSFLAGFSIGRFTALLPLVLTAFAVTYGRSGRLQVAAHAAAIGIYILLAWLIAEQVPFWGIQVELPLSLIAYLLAARSPATRDPAPTSGF
jgi:hypothetical protein